MMRDPSTLYVIGRDWAVERLASGQEVIELEGLAVTRAANVYARSSEQLGLTLNRMPRAPGLVLERGVPLAQAAAASFGHTRVGERLSAGRPLDRVTRAEIEEFQQVAWAEDLPEAERACLLGALLPDQPANALEGWRVGTYALLLELARLRGSGDGSGLPLGQAPVLVEAIRGADRVAQVWERRS